MQGKKFMVSATWNAPREAFDNPQGVLYGGKGTADVFLNITANYKFCGYDVLPDFGVFDIFKNIEAIPAAFEGYQRHLETHCVRSHPASFTQNPLYTIGKISEMYKPCCSKGLTTFAPPNVGVFG